MKGPEGCVHCFWIVEKHAVGNHQRNQKRARRPPNPLAPRVGKGEGSIAVVSEKLAWGWFHYSLLRSCPYAYIHTYIRSVGWMGRARHRPPLRLLLGPYAPRDIDPINRRTSRLQHAPRRSIQAPPHAGWRLPSIGGLDRLACLGWPSGFSESSLVDLPLHARGCLHVSGYSTSLNITAPTTQH